MKGLVFFFWVEGPCDHVKILCKGGVSVRVGPFKGTNKCCVVCIVREVTWNSLVVRFYLFFIDEI